MPVSLRVSPAMERRIARLAQAKATSAHAFMLEAIQEKVDAEEAREAFHAEAERRLARMKRTGKGIPAEEVFDYLRARALGEKAKRPKARKPA